MSWTENATKKILEFTKLEDNWNDEGSGPLPESVAHDISLILEKLKDVDIPDGWVVPHDGGCQIEWRIGKNPVEKSMEIDFSEFYFFIMHWYPSEKRNTAQWRDDFRTYRFNYCEADISAIKLLLSSFFVEDETLYSIQTKYEALTEEV